MFTPKIGEDEPILTSIFFKGVGSTTNQKSFFFDLFFFLFGGTFVGSLRMREAKFPHPKKIHERTLGKMCEFFGTQAKHWESLIHQDFSKNGSQHEETSPTRWTPTSYTWSYNLYKLK